jgi:predicted ribosome quality control (RQC) complex YloA/Tae2 family protein
MTLTYTQILHLVKEAKERCEGAVCRDIIAAGPRAFTLSLQKDRATALLSFTLEPGMSRFHLASQPPAQSVNVPFFKELDKFLRSSTLVDLDVLHADRIVGLTFVKGEKRYRLVIELLPRKPNCYLLDVSEKIIFSLHPADNPTYAYPERRKEVLREETHAPLMTSREVEELYAAIEAEKLQEQQRREIEKLCRQHIKRAECRVQTCLETLEACQKADQVRHEGTLLQSNLYQIRKGMKEIVVADWEQEGKERTLALDTRMDPGKNVAARFLKARKLEKGLPHAQQQLVKAEDALKEARLFCAEALSAATPQEAFVLLKNAGLHSQAISPVRVRRPEPAKPYNCFVSQAGIEIWVGKSAKGNDAMTFQHANGLDWWLHARDYPGSHVAMRGCKGEVPDDASIADAAELAFRFSKGKEQHKGEVCLTQVKGLARVKGVPGKVTLSKYRVVPVRLDDTRWDRLRNSKIS